MGNLEKTFENRIISKYGDVNCPPRSCDLTPLDYYLWGAVKDKCYANNPESIDVLKNEIRVAIADIRAETIKNVLKNWFVEWVIAKSAVVVISPTLFFIKKNYMNQPFQ